MAAHDATITPETRRMAEALGQRGERLGEKLDTISDSARDVYAKGKEHAEAWGDEITLYVKDQPVKSLLIAAGVGLVLGAVLFRR